jgi:hypothetical protein
VADQTSIALLVVLLLTPLGCSRDKARPSHVDSGPFMPDTIGAISLANPERFPSEFRDAAEAAAAYLSKRGLRPDLHFARVFRRDADEIELAVWPASAFSPKGRPRSSGGGGVTLHFNPKTHQIEKAWRWQ